MVEWDWQKADANRSKHRVRFADAVAVLSDDLAITRRDDDPDEDRYSIVGMDPLGRILVVSYTWRGEEIRLISARRATRAKDGRMRAVDRDPMKKFYDFSKGKRGAVIPTPPGKTRITIRIDTEVLDWFRDQVEAAGGGNYQTMMNDVLREHMEGKVEPFEETLRRVLGEVLPGSRSRKKGTRKKTS